MVHDDEGVLFVHRLSERGFMEIGNQGIQAFVDQFVIIVVKKFKLLKSVLSNFGIWKSDCFLVWFFEMIGFGCRSKAAQTARSARHAG
jgi:hypothetical protein